MTGEVNKVKAQISPEEFQTTHVDTPASGRGSRIPCSSVAVRRNFSRKELGPFKKSVRCAPLLDPFYR